MNYTKELLKDNKVKFVVTHTKEEFEHGIEHAYEHLKSKYKVQGFRDGKAPRKVIEKNYGEYVFYDEAINHEFSHAYSEILEKELDVEPIDSPSVNVLELQDCLKYEIIVEVKPEVKLGEYKNLTVEMNKPSVKKDEVEAELKLAQDKASRFVEVEREAKDGDTVNINFLGKVNGVAFDGGKAENYDLVLGSHSFIDGFEDQLVGMKKGEEKVITVTFPDDYMAENLKGKDATFDILVNSVKEKELPELNDEFAQNYSEFETLEDYKKDIKKHLLEEKKKEAKYEAENKLIDLITDNSTVEISNTLVERQIDEFIKDFEYRLMYQGLKLDDYLNHVGTTMIELRNSRREDALKTAKTKLVLEAIIKNENIDISKEEMEAKLKEMAEQRNIDVEEFKKGLNQQFFDRIFGQMITDKLLAFLTENNNLA